MSRLRSSPAPPLDNEDLLEKILLRLPPQPSSLPRASLVCKRWRSILSDSKFISRFRKHHGKPPLLGFFATDIGTEHLLFTSALEPPNHIPAARFPVPRSRNTKKSWQWTFQGCRHGVALLINHTRRVVVSWDPLTDELHRVPFPMGFVIKQESCFSHGAVICADAEDVHRSFKFVLICSGETQASACVYESSSGVWENAVSTMTNDRVLGLKPNVLIGNAIYWLFIRGDILVFDIERHALSVIEKPAAAHRADYWSFQLLRIHDDGSNLGLAVMSELSIQFWERKSKCDAVAQWTLLQQIIHLEGLLPRGIDNFFRRVYMVGYDEDSNVIVLVTYIGEFMLQLDSMGIKTISRGSRWNVSGHHPYSNFYTAGKGIGGKWLDP